MTRLVWALLGCGVVAACERPAGDCSLSIEGTPDDGTFGWCDVLLVAPVEENGPRTVRLLAEKLEGCEDDCHFIAEFPEGVEPDCSEADGLGLNPISSVSLSLPGFPSEEVGGPRVGGAAFFHEGSSCQIETTRLELDTLGVGIDHSWEGRIEAHLLLQDGSFADVVISGVIPPRIADYLDSGDPQLRGR